MPWSAWSPCVSARRLCARSSCASLQNAHAARPCSVCDKIAPLDRCRQQDRSPAAAAIGRQSSRRRRSAPISTAIAATHFSRPPRSWKLSTCVLIGARKFSAQCGLPAEHRVARPTRPRHVPRSWQARRESNPQPAVLETAALPIELLAFVPGTRHVQCCATRGCSFNDFGDHTGAHRAPAFAHRKPQPLFHRDRRYQLTVIWMLSPGITISTPSGKSTEPVTSVVRK